MTVQHISLSAISQLPLSLSYQLPGLFDTGVNKDNRCSLSLRNYHIFHMFIIKQVCQTKECVSVAAEIIESADMSADPCTNFYQVLLSHNFAFGWISSRNTIQTESDNNVIPPAPFSSMLAVVGWRTTQFQAGNPAGALSKNCGRLKSNEKPSFKKVTKKAGQPKHPANGAWAASEEGGGGLYCLRKGSHILQCLSW